MLVGCRLLNHSLRTGLRGSAPVALPIRTFVGQSNIRIMAEGPLREVSREEALSADPPYRHACHAMLHAPTGLMLFNTYDMNQAIMMQMRFDGKLGFPGGLVDAGETLEEALNRELQEEIGFSDTESLKITADERLCSHVLEEKRLCLHFFIRSLTWEQYLQLEEAGTKADHFGTEVLGLIRCPTYRMGTTDGGLPSFLRNSFVGNARQQLLMGIKHAGILTEEDIALVDSISKMKPVPK